jgi:hypothetical protein
MLSRAFELIIDTPGALALDLPNCVQSFRSTLDLERKAFAGESSHGPDQCAKCGWGPFGQGMKRMDFCYGSARLLA